MNNNNYAIIMAGGVGSRFWPLSKTERPKQFIDVLGTGKTLIQQTYARINRVCPKENILVITNKLYENKIKEQLPYIPEENVLCEPQRRNTAPCITYGAFKIKKKNPKANILVAPSDHIILREDLFVEVVKKGFEFASKNDALLTIGIKPHKPETGYGYIRSKGVKIDENKGRWILSMVSGFTEKPGLKQANKYVKNGKYFWNAGIFIWSAYSILDAIEKHLPILFGQFHDHLNSINTPKEPAAIDAIYDVCENISIDYGVMEKANNVYVISTDIGWSDLGSWSALQELKDADAYGNVSNTNKALFYNSKNCLVRIHNGKVAVIDGLEDAIVVEDEKALLICKKQDEQRIKEFVEDVAIHFGKQYV
jgi:mannose-1-phosphate guanylyltransferase